MERENRGLHLNNTLTRKKELFKAKGEVVKMFTCGPSIYRKPHIGNYRTFLYEDVLQRYLEYLGYDVERIINFTDVEDKSVEEALRRGESLEDVTVPAENQFYKDADLFKMKLPEVIPRSSTILEEAVRLIEILMKKGHAYRYGSDIFFDPLKYKGFGKLYGLDMDRWPRKKRRFRKDTYPGQRWNLGDFILWHGYRDGEEGAIYWDTSIGKGRPSWNIQDPAIISKHLGDELDVFCGGVDNLFRHHDYTLAIMESISGKKLARYWLHGEHVVINGSKMSKSKGNIIYPDDLVERGYSGQHIRFYLIEGHYRKKKNLTTDALQRSAVALDAFKAMLQKVIGVEDVIDKSDVSAEGLIQGLKSGFEERMNDDLDVGGAFEAVYQKLFGLMGLKMDRKLSDRDCERIEKWIEEFNGVLQIL